MSSGLSATPTVPSAPPQNVSLEVVLSRVKHRDTQTHKHRHTHTHTHRDREMVVMENNVKAFVLVR